MKLVRINESSQELNELFGKKAKKAKNSSKNSSKQSNVERNVFNNNNVKKWLSQARYTGKDLAAGFQGINDTAKVTLNGNRTIGVALYHSKCGNAMAVAVLGNGDSISSLWVKSDLFSGEPSWSKIMDSFMQCEDIRDVENAVKKFKFSEHKTY